MKYSPEEYSSYIRSIFEILDFLHWRCYISPYIFRWNHPDELKSPDYDGSLLILARMVKTVDPGRVSEYSYLAVDKITKTCLVLNDIRSGALPLINNFVSTLRGNSLISGLITELCTRNPYMKIYFDRKFLVEERHKEVKVLRVAAKLDELQEEYAYSSFKGIGQTTESLKLRELYLMKKLYSLSRKVSNFELAGQVRPVLDGLIFRVSQLYSSRLYKFYNIPYPYSKTLTYRYTRDYTDYIHRRMKNETRL